MPQIFHHSTNYIAKATIFGAVFILLAATWVGAEISRSSWNTGSYQEIEQPVQFSHKHHVGDDGIDCRVCHTSVETSANAGMPSTQTCMSCHSQIWNDSPYLEPVKASWRTGKPIEWVRVHDLPDYVYFNHSIHVNKGVGCATCHGRVDQMPIVYQKSSLQMEWCLQCHRNPEQFVGPKSRVFDVAWDRKDAKPEERGENLVQTYKIKKADVLTSCSTCHR